MMILLHGALVAEDVERVLAELRAAAWKDGKTTAGHAARPVKFNRQAAGDDVRMQGVEAFVLASLRRHPLFDLAARPKRLSRLLFSRYADGETYGDHTDDALMGDPPLRTDLAFTLFISEPETYDGGALVTTTLLGEQAIKLAAGDAVLYAADTIHRVEPVTRGERIAAVGWLESLVRDSRQRELLFDLATARTRLADGGAGRDDLVLLDKVRGNLLRMWAET